MGRNCSCGVRFWSWWTAASCQRGVSQRVCDQGGRDQPQFSLHASVSWRRAGPLEMEDCSQSPSLQTEWHAAVCPCPWRRQQRADGDGRGEDGLSDGGVEVQFQYIQQSIMLLLIVAHNVKWPWDSLKAPINKLYHYMIGFKVESFVSLMWQKT